MGTTLSDSRAWDYSLLAATYDLRVDYSATLIEHVLRSIGVRPGERAVDVGAGTGKLTSALCTFGLAVAAVEPNDRMRAVARAKCDIGSAWWIAARAEALPLASRTQRLVCFGSSFNVVDASAALDESARVLEPGSHWLALWNHRDLDDPLQRDIERLVHRHLPHFDYGARRASPAPVVAAHGAFCNVSQYEERFVARVRTIDWMRAWQSHATLRRQAGNRFQAILDDIGQRVRTTTVLEIPYFTRAWTAQRR